MPDQSEASTEHALLQEITAPLAEALGPSDRHLRSRAGKNSRIELHAARGLAYSHDGDHLEFVEVFPPATADWYLAEVYEDPGEFYK